MTMVARLAIKDCPILVGDLLLSGPPLPGVTAVIPTADDLSTAFAPGSKLVPRDLGQKIAVVAENLVVGWAGSYDVARDVVSELVQLSAAQPFTNDTLKQHFDSLSSKVWSEIGLLGFVRDSKGVAQFGRSYYNLPTQIFGNVGLLGSGMDDLKAFLQRNSKLPEAGGFPMNALQESIGFGLLLTGVFLNVELATLESLNSFYGGGYEIAVSENAKFRKLDDVTYLFWTASVDGNEVRLGRIPRRVFRYAYRNDLLVIRSTAFRDDQANVSIRDDLFPVPPIYRDLRPDEESGQPAPALNAKWLCIFFLVSFPGGKRAISVKVRYQPQEQKWVKFVDVPGGVCVAVEHAFIEEMVREILRETDVIPR